MSAETHKYLIVGAGLTGASAARGIRELDKEGALLMMGGEPHLPYHRPPLSKDLWFGKKQVEGIFVKGQDFYDANGIELALGVEAVALDAGNRTVTDSQGRTHRFEKLLLATGGAPRRLEIPGGDLDGVCYYRRLDDYLATRPQASEGKSAVVIGGGFIGSEIAAALNTVKVEVTMIYPDQWLVHQVFPEGLGRALQQKYQQRGIRTFTRDRPVSIERAGGKFVTRTQHGQQVESDMVIVGIGILPSVELARQAGLEVGNGIVVNEFLQTSHPDIYAGGDNAFFPYRALDESMRIEHWDCALSQGKSAGRNMAGAGEPYTYMPYFFSDLFEFGYEAVGKVLGRLETFADWRQENETGVVYYLEDGKVKGAMMCNLWKKLDAARELIGQGKRAAPEDLRGAIG